MLKIIFVLSLCSLLIIPNLSIANVAEDGLVAYWPFDEGDGKKADGYHRQWTRWRVCLVIPKWVDGKVRHCSRI